MRIIKHKSKEYVCRTPSNYRLTFLAKLNSFDHYICIIESFSSKIRVFLGEKSEKMKELKSANLRRLSDRIRISSSNGEVIDIKSKTKAYYAGVVMEKVIYNYFSCPEGANEGIMKVEINNGQGQVSNLPVGAHIYFFAQVHNFTKEMNYDDHPFILNYNHTYVLVCKTPRTEKKKIFFGRLNEEMEDLGFAMIQKSEKKTEIKSSRGKKIIIIRNSDYAVYEGLIMDYVIINELFPGYIPAT